MPKFILVQRDARYTCMSIGVTYGPFKNHYWGVEAFEGGHPDFAICWRGCPGFVNCLRGCTQILPNTNYKKTWKRKTYPSNIFWMVGYLIHAIDMIKPPPPHMVLRKFNFPWGGGGGNLGKQCIVKNSAVHRIIRVSSSYVVVMFGGTHSFSHFTATVGQNTIENCLRGYQ